MAREDSAGAKRAIGERLIATRKLTLALSTPLSDADATIQAFADASPAKWHLAHTSWFFETFVLRDYVPSYRAFDERFAFLFNSYYEAEGARHARPRRGMLSRPSLGEIQAYRAQIDEALEKALPALPKAALELVELGINHEQQHQELLLTDLLAAFAANPIEPAYGALPAPACFAVEPLSYHPGRTGIVKIGAAEPGFAFDSERPQHCVFLSPHRIANRRITNSEWREFINGGGYLTPTLWLSDGWAWMEQEAISKPLYWCGDGTEFTLGGRREIDWAAPVAHVSYYEADAFARWAGSRLPTEAEWEDFAASADPNLGNQLDEAAPVIARAGGGIFGDVWEWTPSSRRPRAGNLRGCALLKTLDSQTIALRDDVLAGLQAPIPAIPARWLYDRRGSELFDEITRLAAYYPTRTEMAIFQSAMPEIAARVPKGAVVVEFGAGSQTKTPILLKAIEPSAYVPVDISGDYLEQSSAELQQRFPKLEVIPVVADFARPFNLPGGIEHLPKFGFFPGSTIGNFVPWSATDLLRLFRGLLGPGAQLLIGMDRVKPVDRLITAYDDPEGVTAQFTLNLLTRINRELDGDIPVGAYRHDARWNDILSRIEIHLVATKDLSFSVAGHNFSFAKGSSIHVENSHKYGPRGGRMLLLAGGWTPIAEWSDPAGDFAEILAVAEPERFAP